MGESFRDFSAHLADRSLLQWFCQLGQMDRIQPPAKSTLQRYAGWFPEQKVRHLNTRLLNQAAQEANPWELMETIDLEGMILDTTCVKANIHFPADWLLMQDAARSLLTTISTIRKHGLKHRMPDPEQLLGDMNRQAVEMSQCRRRAQTEGRIGIFKNQFLGRPMRAKGFDNQHLAVTWAGLTHNLWALARLPVRQKPKEEPLGQAA